MTKNASITTTTQDPQTTMAYLEAFKRLKRLKPIEPTLGILGLFFLTLFCFLFGFFYLDYRVIVKGFRFHGQPQKFLLLGGSNNESSSEKVGFLDGEMGRRECDLFDGEWVWDESYPLYQSKDCKLLDEGFRCTENGRPDDFYTKWRWQPQNCNLPRFDAKTMLEKLRNKRLAFVGDSIGRNQWESLLCMLSSVIPDKNSIYEVNGSPITKHNGFLVFMFRDYNCTIEYYRAPFLVIQGRAPSGSPKEVKTTLRLDRLDWTSWQWRDADILIFNTGHWWNYEKTIRGGCYFQEGEEIKMNMTVPEAYQRSLETLVDWIGREVNMTKTQVFFRTYAPVHFRGGDWKTGGSCHLEKVPAIGLPLLPSQTWPELHIFNKVLSNYSNKTRLSSLDILNVTQMTSRRKDGHSSLYYSRAGRAPLHRQDCSHWCLPGVPDTWNEILYALFLRNYAARTQHSTKRHSQTAH